MLTFDFFFKMHSENYRSLTFLWRKAKEACEVWFIKTSASFSSYRCSVSGLLAQSVWFGLALPGRSIVL